MVIELPKYMLIRSNIAELVTNVFNLFLQQGTLGMDMS